MDQPNRASSEHFDVELVAVARDVETDGDFFDDPETVDAVLFFEVENTADDPVEWWHDEHCFVDGEGYQYGSGGSVGGAFEDAPGFAPSYWRHHVEVRPGLTARCVTWVDDLPEGTTLRRVVYDYEGDAYELAVDETKLDAPPV
ncbi:MAG: hypothetical protein ABEJ04_05440 [Halobacteriaceae archaeon]